MAAEVVDAGPVAFGLFGELSIPREYVLVQQGREYILADGLLVGLVQLSKGYYDLSTEIVQLPTPQNEQTAVVTAKVTVFEPATGDVLRIATGIGDASPANVGRMVAPHVLRMAETRGVARALRHLLGVGLTALEELSPEDQPVAAPPAERQAPAPPPAAPLVERIEVEGTVYTRQQVEARFVQRREKTVALGIVLPPELAGLTVGAPLRDLVGATQQMRRLCEATQAGQR